MNGAAGLYIHIPFCGGKCFYCSFYSKKAAKNDMNAYIRELSSRMTEYGEIYNGRLFDTVFIGGGTPSLLGGEGVASVLRAARSAFHLAADTEITMECNPEAAAQKNFFKEIAAAGVNRVSFGMQSAVDAELSAIGRRHKAADTVAAVKSAKAAGIDNLSLDIMLGLPYQTAQSLEVTLNAAAALPVTHISAYMLSLEPDTPLYNRNLPLPDDDTLAELYIKTAGFLERNGFDRYEISNFARPGYESHHNLKYWQLADYLGLGPAAHSMMDGKRFYFPADREAFIRGESPVADGDGGTLSEAIMLGTRLAAGIDLNRLHDEYGLDVAVFIEKTKLHILSGLAVLKNGIFRLTESGMLLQNSIISELI